MRLIGLIAASATAIAVVGAIAPAAATPTGIPTALLGCWGHNAPIQAGIPGVWHVAVKPTGGVVAYNPAESGCIGVADFTGRITVSGGHLTIGPLPLCGGPGTYNWTVTGKSLKLARVKDACALRAGLFSGVWKRK
jgi:hypothetical protein